VRLSSTPKYISRTYDSRRIEHIFGTVKPLAADKGVASFLGVWDKTLVLGMYKQAGTYEPPSKGSKLSSPSRTRLARRPSHRSVGSVFFVGSDRTEIARR
jgi:hypothetical protein